MKLCPLAALLLLSLAPPTSSQGVGTWDLHFLTLGVADGAVCLDGSP
jgi:hypothetical protein